MASLAALAFGLAASTSTETVKQGIPRDDVSNKHSVWITNSSSSNEHNAVMRTLALVTVNNYTDDDDGDGTDDEDDDRKEYDGDALCDDEKSDHM